MALPDLGQRPEHEEQKHGERLPAEPLEYEPVTHPLVTGAAVRHRADIRAKKRPANGTGSCGAGPRVSDARLISDPAPGAPRAPRAKPPRRSRRRRASRRRSTPGWRGTMRW